MRQWANPHFVEHIQQQHQAKYAAAERQRTVGDARARAAFAERENDPQAKTRRRRAGEDTSKYKMCFWCHGECKSDLRCSRCKSFYYCSQKCATDDWTKPNPSGSGRTHKQMCKDAIKHMQRQPEFDEVDELFSSFWLQKGKDGITHEDVMLHNLGLLGYTPDEVGYWARASDAVPRDMAKVYENRRYKLYGVQLLSQLPEDDLAWHLQDPKKVPKLHFDDVHLPPAPPGEHVVSWASWYSWRGITLESPCAILMHFPLSVYKMLQVAGVVQPADLHIKEGRARRKLVVHYVGIERELDFLPLFAELALLIPQCDIELKFFGTAAKTLVDYAKKTAPSSPAAQKVTYSYTAPAELGGSTFQAVLAGAKATWTHNEADQLDAIVACNAGLGTYSEWYEVIGEAAVLGVPFMQTEYMEMSVDFILRELPDFWRALKFSPTTVLGLPREKRALWDSAPTRAGPVLVNPFHQPGRRHLHVTTPNYSNALIMRVC